jgi:hypothetical protein
MTQSPQPADEGELEKFLDFVIDRIFYMIEQPVAGDWQEHTKKPIRSRVKALLAQRDAAIKGRLLEALPPMRVMPFINEEWTEAWMWQGGGCTNFNQALALTIDAIERVFSAPTPANGKDAPLGMGDV